MSDSENSFHERRMSESSDMEKRKGSNDFELKCERIFIKKIERKYKKEHCSQNNEKKKHSKKKDSKHYSEHSCHSHKKKKKHCGRKRKIVDLGKR